MSKRVFGNIRPFAVPYGVQFGMPEVDGEFVDYQRTGLRSLNPKELSTLCDNFRATIFERAGVADPMKTPVADTSHLTRGPLTCYAPGDGALSFTYVGHGPFSDISVGDPAHYDEIPKIMIPGGWRLMKLNGQIRAYNPVVRLSPSMLDLDGELYLYGVQYEFSPGHASYLITTPNKKSVVNVNVVSQLSFYLNNEPHILSAEGGE